MLRGLVADTRPLRSEHFARLWRANIITVVGAQLTVVAVPAQIYAETGSSAYVGLTGVFGLVPLVVFGLYGGALADHFDRRTLLVITTAGIIGTSFLLVLGGAADVASSAFRNTMLMTMASDGVRGRLQGVFIVVVAGGPRVADVAHGVTAVAVGTAAAAAGGGILVVVGTVVAALAVPAFVRYRVTPSGRP